MKLRVDDITADAREITFSEPEGDINRALGLGPIREYRLEGPVNVALTYYRAGTELFFRGEFTAATIATCARFGFMMARRRCIAGALRKKSIGMEPIGERQF